jgi:hypothetical protein
MMTSKFFVTATAILILILGAASLSQATTLRAFVSSTGNDANAATNCGQAAPCRTFAGAYPTVTPGGELIALDTAGYGPLNSANTITKSITIAAIPGQTAFVVAAAGTMAFVTLPAAGDTIILRNLSFNGSGASNTTGIQHNGGRLLINNCKFAQLTQGLWVNNAKADVVDSEFTANGTAIVSNGPGWNMSSPLTPSVALVTLQGGSIKFNSLALLTQNPGAGASNIWVFSVANLQPLTGIAQNSAFMLSDGSGCPCSNPGWYQSISSASPK